jgi:hypothetical protein
MHPPGKYVLKDEESQPVPLPDSFVLARIKQVGVLSAVTVSP